MAEADSFRARLEALLEQLAKGTGEASVEAATTASAEAGTASGLETDEHVSALEALTDYLGKAAEGTDEILTAHPYAAIGAAFMLGVAVGRLTR